MTEITDEDVTSGGRALHTAWVRMDEGLDLFGKDAHQYLARAVLDAVLPAYTARKRLEWEHDEACGGLPLVEHDRALSKWVRAAQLRALIEQPVHPLTREWLLSVLERVEGE